MKDQKRPKLSLKRKQSILPDANAAAKNAKSITSDKTPTRTWADSISNAKTGVTTTDSASVRGNGTCMDAGENQIVISISDDDEPFAKKDRYSSESEERKPNLDQTTVNRCGFLNVENQNLRKLRESFLNLRRIKNADIKSLPDLPPYQDHESEGERDRKYQDNLNKESKDVHSLSLLPPLCKWCQYRKPVSLRDQYPYESFWNFENLMTECMQNSNKISDSGSSTEMKTLIVPDKKELDYKKKELSKNIENDKAGASWSGTDKDIKKNEQKHQSFQIGKDSSVKTLISEVTERKVLSHNSHTGFKNSDNKNSLHGLLNKNLGHKDMYSNISFEVVARQRLNPEKRYLVSRQNEEKMDDQESERASVTFAGGEIQPVKTSRSSSDIRRTDSAITKSNKHCSKTVTNSTTSRSVDAHPDRHCSNTKMNSTTSRSVDALADKGTDSEIDSCPLCQKQFDQWMKQIDKDGHIAACFAASSDDVTW